MERRIKLLIVDHMALVRKAVTEGFAGSTSVDVVGTTANTQLAGRQIAKTQPDVILLDLEPPVRSALAVLQELLEGFPIPVVLLTGLDAADRDKVIDGLKVKRSNVIVKPATGIREGVNAALPQIETAVQRAHRENVLHWQRKRHVPVCLAPQSTRAQAHAGDRLIAIGASTGGTEAICEVVSQLPREIPGIVIVQHMPVGFTRMFAERLNELCDIEVREAADGDEIKPGLALVAPSGYQVHVVRTGRGYTVRVEAGAKVNGHCPSADVLMHSVAKQAGAEAIGVILTGMGNDGAEGLKAMRDSGGRTFAQDEATSIIFGMPKSAYQLGGAERLVPLGEMASVVCGSL